VDDPSCAGEEGLRMTPDLRDEEGVGNGAEAVGRPSWV
jgi:hypothetical protein